MDRSCSSIVSAQFFTFPKVCTIVIIQNTKRRTKTDAYRHTYTQAGACAVVSSNSQSNVPFSLFSSVSVMPSFVLVLFCSGCSPLPFPSSPFVDFPVWECLRFVFFEYCAPDLDTTATATSLGNHSKYATLNPPINNDTTVLIALHHSPPRMKPWVDHIKHMENDLLG